MRRLVVRIIVGSIRRGRRSLPVAEYLRSIAGERPELAADLLDLSDYPLPLLEERTEEENALPAARALFQQIGEADALLIVTPEYKGGVPGVLKNAFDYLPPGFLRRKPVGICTVSAGGYGGINCLAQLRLLVLSLGGLPIPEFVAVSKVNEVVGGGAASLERACGVKLRTFLWELLWYCEAMALQRDRDEICGQGARVSA